MQVVTAGYGNGVCWYLWGVVNVAGAVRGRKACSTIPHAKALLPRANKPHHGNAA